MNLGNVARHGVSRLARMSELIALENVPAFEGRIRVLPDGPARCSTSHYSQAEPLG
jgi:hypothetical protein